MIIHHDKKNETILINSRKFEQSTKADKLLLNLYQRGLKPHGGWSKTVPQLERDAVTPGQIKTASWDGSLQRKSHPF